MSAHGRLKSQALQMLGILGLSTFEGEDQIGGIWA